VAEYVEGPLERLLAELHPFAIPDDAEVTV
jgi:hypothetical protein